MGLKQKEEARPQLLQYKVYSDYELRVFHEKLTAKEKEIYAMDGTGLMEYTAWKLGYMTQEVSKTATGKDRYTYRIVAKKIGEEFDYSLWRKFEDFWRQYKKYAERMRFSAQKSLEELGKLSESVSLEEKIAADVKNF